MPEWFGAVFMLCILSASMSTLSAQFHTMGAAFGADAFPKLGRSKNPNSTLGVRIGVLYPARGLGQLMGRRLGQFIRHVVPS